jgi:hypothetical protein
VGISSILGGFSAGRHLFERDFRTASPRLRTGSPQLNRDD